MRTHTINIQNIHTTNKHQIRVSFASINPKSKHPYLPPFKNKKHNNNTITEGKYPFGSVPVLEVDGVIYAQSVGILRYVGRVGGVCELCEFVLGGWERKSHMHVHACMHACADASGSTPHNTGLYPDLPVEAGLAVDQVVGGVEDLIVATVPFLFAKEAEKVGPSLWRW